MFNFNFFLIFIYIFLILVVIFYMVGMMHVWIQFKLEVTLDLITMLDISITALYIFLSLWCMFGCFASDFEFFVYIFMSVFYIQMNLMCLVLLYIMFFELVFMGDYNLIYENYPFMISLILLEFSLILVLMIFMQM